jgi:hypothetical protein
MKQKHASETHSSSHHRESNPISPHRWLAYAAAGAATAAMGAQTSKGDMIHYSGKINEHFNATQPGGGVCDYLPLAQPQKGLLYNSLVPQHSRLAAPRSSQGLGAMNVFGFATQAIVGFNATRASTSKHFSRPYASKLGFGQNISAQHFDNNFYGFLAEGFGHGHSQWLAPGTGFFGFRFNNGDGVQYGWARITMDGAPNDSFTLVDSAWGDVGQKIRTGQKTVSESGGSLGLLAIGCAGLLAWRRAGRACAESAA